MAAFRSSLACRCRRRCTRRRSRPRSAVRGRRERAQRRQASLRERRAPLGAPRPHHAIARRAAAFAHVVTAAPLAVAAAAASVAAAALGLGLGLGRRGARRHSGATASLTTFDAIKSFRPTPSTRIAEQHVAGVVQVNRREEERAAGGWPLAVSARMISSVPSPWCTSKSTTATRPTRTSAAAAGFAPAALCPLAAGAASAAASAAASRGAGGGGGGRLTCAAATIAELKTQNPRRDRRGMSSRVPAWCPGGRTMPSRVARRAGEHVSTAASRRAGGAAGGGVRSGGEARVREPSVLELARGHVVRASARAA